MNSLTLIIVAYFCVNGVNEVQPKIYTKFIVDGYDVLPGELPFMVSIQYKGQHICGGSIINAYTVLTAAHCFQQYMRWVDLQQDAPTMQTFPSSLSMTTQYSTIALSKTLRISVSGATVLKVDNKSPISLINNLKTLKRITAGVVDLDTKYQIRRVNTVIIHPNFRKKLYLYDIALLKVDEAFFFDDFINAVQLDTNNAPLYSERRGTIAGWGKTSEADISYSKRLKVALVKILSDDSCKSAIGEDVDVGLCCSLPTYFNEGACQMDSGGPLLYGSRLMGIISAGVGCTNKYYPGMYTKVSYFKTWIMLYM